MVYCLKCYPNLPSNIVSLAVHFQLSGGDMKMYTISFNIGNHCYLYYNCMDGPAGKCTSRGYLAGSEHGLYGLRQLNLSEILWPILHTLPPKYFLNV